MLEQADNASLEKWFDEEKHGEACSWLFYGKTGNYFICSMYDLPKDGVPETLVGMFRVSAEYENQVSISSVMIGKSFKGKGMGSWMMQQIKDMFKGKEICLMCTEENLPFYLGNGFVMDLKNSKTGYFYMSFVDKDLSI